MYTNQPSYYNNTPVVSREFYAKWVMCTTSKQQVDFIPLLTNLNLNGVFCFLYLNLRPMGLNRTRGYQSHLLQRCQSRLMWSLTIFPYHLSPVLVNQ